MPVRILLMDIDDTLFDFQTGYKRALRAALAQFGVECTPQLLELYGSINDRLWERFERGEIAKDALYDERFRQLFERCGIDASPAACNEAYHNALRLQHDLMPHCEQVLRQLHERYQICIVTNGSTDIQTRRIADSGMAKYFDRVFISEQMGCKKPDREFFDKVFAELGEENRACAVMIGDSLSSDMQGGRNACLPTIFCGPRARADARCDQVAETLLDLPPLLAAMRAPQRLPSQGPIPPIRGKCPEGTKGVGMLARRSRD